MDPTRNNPPVAVRVVRPYPNEDALLAAEANAFTRTGVVLIGGPSRPNGVVLRFEICCQGGVVMRGEGRVVGYRAPSSGEESALMLRFTRLDVRSKSLLDRAVAMREERRSVAPKSPPSAPPRAPSAPPPPPPSAAPTTEREDPDSIPSPPPLAMAGGPAPARADDDDVEEVDDADVESDDDDLTEQAPPVAMLADAGPGKEKMPVPSPSPGGVPAPKQQPPAQPAPPRHAPEPTPERRAPEHVPPPQPSPEPKRHASEVLARVRESRSEFRPSLPPEQRDSALDRLRTRKKA